MSNYKRKYPRGPKMVKWSSPKEKQPGFEVPECVLHKKSGKSKVCKVHKGPHQFTELKHYTGGSNEKIIYSWKTCACGKRGEFIFPKDLFKHL